MQKVWIVVDNNPDTDDNWYRILAVYNNVREADKHKKIAANFGNRPTIVVERTLQDKVNI